jgi:hypothetical protein
VIGDAHLKEESERSGGQVHRHTATRDLLGKSSVLIRQVLKSVCLLRQSSRLIDCFVWYFVYTDRDNDLVLDNVCVCVCVCVALSM